MGVFVLNFSLSTDTNGSDPIEGSNETIFSQYPPELLDFAAICCVIFAVVGVVGNVLTVAALLSVPKLRNATTAFIINLCVADLFFCAFSLPLSAVTFFEREWNHGDVLCHLFPLIRYSNAAVSIFSVIAITFNRYILIVHPAKYPKIYRPTNIAIMIVSLWLSAFLLFSLPLSGVWGRFGYDPSVGTCSILQLNGKSPKMYLYAMAFVVPSIVFVICYLRIYFVVRKSSRKFREGASNPNRIHDTSANNITFGTSRWVFSRRYSYDNSGFVDDMSRSTFTGSQKRDKKELRVLRVMLVIFITFVLCYFPVSLVKISQKEQKWPFLNIVGYLTVYFSNCINPVIYVVVSKEYRKAYAHFLCRRFRDNRTKPQRRPPMDLMDVPADSFKYINVCLPKL